jgi:hypothetical protein
MKLRIKGNSIRIRLSRTEVDTLGTEGYLEETTEFPDSKFVYALQAKADISALSATHTNGKITVLIPAHMAAGWNNNETIGHDNNMDLGNNKQLYLLVEKDFKCIDSVDEDQSDNYENPKQSC